MSANGFSMGFAMMTDQSSTNYYFTSYSSNTIFVFDDNWNYLYNKAFSSPLSIATAGSNFYITSSTNIHKTDKNLNINKTYAINYLYSVIYYNQTSNLMYVGGIQSNQINILDSNLNLVDLFNLTGIYYYNTVSAIQGYNNYLYIGIANYNGNGRGEVLVLFNKMIVQTINGCFNSYLSSYQVFSILFDENGYMATACNNQANLFNQSLSYIYTSTNFESSFNFMSLDSKNRLITLSSYNVIYIYSRGTLSFIFVPYFCFYLLDPLSVL